jgi:GT2 family glycosyltransferase
MNLQSSYSYEASIIIVVMNVRDLLRECLQSALQECARLPQGMRVEILITDNGSKDGTEEMVAKEFCSTDHPVRLFRSEVNLGFASANNLAMEQAQGRYIVLLNSDAFFHPGALLRAIEHMDANPDVGVGAGRQVSPDGGFQPSARSFPSVWLDALVLSGLPDRYPKSRIFGAPNRTWADPDEAMDVDWSTGAFLILRREALAKTGLFDPDFFLYSEEVDLCRRVKAAGDRVYYWPDIVVTHIGGATTKQMKSHAISKASSEVLLWRMRSTLLYYRKHHGWQAFLLRALDEGFYSLRRLRNACSTDPARREQAKEFALMASLMHQAWIDTQGGRVSPPRPW